MEELRGGCRMQRIVGPSHFLNYPTDHTAGFFDSDQDVKEFLADLSASEFDFDKEACDDLAGAEGLEVVDLSGTHHGLYARFIRMSQKFFGTGEWELVEKADLELKLGHHLLAVPTLQENQKEIIAGLMKKHGGHDIRYFNPFYVEQL
jgi:hypothetical protein